MFSSNTLAGHLLCAPPLGTTGFTNGCHFSKDSLSFDLFIFSQISGVWQMLALVITHCRTLQTDKFEMEGRFHIWFVVHPECVCV